MRRENKKLSVGVDGYLGALGTAIREFRELGYKSQEEVAHDSDMAVSYYARIERGTINTSVKKIRSICVAMDISAGELLSKADEIYLSTT